jgi:hypothetical protein
LSADQQRAVDAIGGKPGPFFLTGPAGSGKSFVINYLRATVPGCVVTATTGAAAQLIGGRTLHSFASIHPRYGAVRSRAANTRARACDLLVIDEVSMANDQLMCLLDDRFDQAGHWPKLLLVGDFLQLPPVDGTPLFRSPLWPSYEVLTLTTQHRQVDGDFVSVLGDLRSGLLTERAKAFIGMRRVDDLPDDCTHLMAHKSSAERRNLLRLKQLPGVPGRSQWQVQWMVKEKSRDVRHLREARLLPELRLKAGARVVMLTNTDDWVNGSTGHVEYILPGSVGVRLDAGPSVRVGKVDEDVLDADGKTVCRVTQYPIMLAWSLTIHKSQGMTIDRVGVDLGGHFAPGQTYVALSRCRTADGLFLVGKLDGLVVDPETVGLFG